MSSHSEAYFYVRHTCGGDNSLEMKRYRDTYEKAVSDFDRLRDKEKLDHLNCTWEVCCELRDYQGNRLVSTMTMIVEETA
jgi:hypothetical protein